MNFDTDLNETDEAKMGDELTLLLESPHLYIRNKIKSQVDDCLWAYGLKSAYDVLQEKMSSMKTISERCAVCSLQYGTCSHTQDWMATKVHFDEEVKDGVDNELDDIMDLVGSGVVVDTKPGTFF